MLKSIKYLLHTGSEITPLFLNMCSFKIFFVKIRNFRQKSSFDSLPKTSFYFLVKISISDQNFDFCPNLCIFLPKNLIFRQKKCNFTRPNFGSIRVLPAFVCYRHSCLAVKRTTLTSSAVISVRR